MKDWRLVGDDVRRWTLDAWLILKSQPRRVDETKRMSGGGADNGTIAFGSLKPVFGMAPPDKARLRKATGNSHSPQFGLFENPKKAKRVPTLPARDNTPEGLRALLEANAHYRQVPWPEPYQRTTHRLRLGDARDLSWIPDASVHLVVTSPPYWTLKEYAAGNRDQMGHFEDYEHFLSELDRVWRECARVLVGEVESAALWAMFVYPGNAAGGITSCHYTRIFRSALVSTALIASSRFYGTRSRMA